MTATIDEYIAGAPEDVRPVLERIRRTIHEAVPGAGEKISYNMPTITVDGQYLVYFAAWKHHISVYPIPRSGLEDELAPYLAAKGTLRFPLKTPIPYELIGRVAQRLRDEKG
jgi:uncharacterized protein YdhG (YjbR/CyaY superfamily)